MSKKFTGITSAGSAIPVYDKDAHSALEQKLDTAVYSAASGNFLTAVPDEYAKTSAVEDMVSAASADLNTAIGNKLDTSSFADVSGSFLTEVPESAVSGFATHEEVESATSGKLNASASGSLPYVRYNSADSAVDAPGAMYYYRDGGDRFFKVNDLIDVYDNVNYDGAGNIKMPYLSADAYGVSGGRTSTSYSGSAAGAFRIKANQNAEPYPYIQLIGAASYTGNGVFVGVDSACGVDYNGRKRWNVKNGDSDTNPSFSMEGVASAYGNGVFIDVNGASGVDGYGNVKWQVGGPASQLFNGAMDKKPAILLVSPPTSDQYSAQWSGSPYISAGNPVEGITLSYGPTASTPNIKITPNGINANYTSSYASFTTADATISRYSAYNDPNKIDWSLTGSVQKREIECDSATSAITAIAGSAIGGKEYSAGANIDITDEVISGKDWSDEIVAATSGLQPSGDYLSASESANFYPMTGNPSGFLTEHQSLDSYLQNSDLTIVDDKITEISGVELSAGTSLEFEYDSADNISAINSSAISTTPSQALYAKSPLYAGVSGTSSFIGVDETLLAQLIESAASARYNETVLYSATPKNYGGDSSGESIALSENISSFERLRFYINVMKGENSPMYYETYEVDNYLGSACNFQYGPYPENNVTANWFILRAWVTNNICNVSATYNASTSVQNPYWGNKWFPGSLYKVVGINRKEA